jgi:hypothetical protein
MTNYGEDDRFQQQLERQKEEDYLWNKIPSLYECGWVCDCEKSQCNRETGLDIYIRFKDDNTI